MQPMAMSTSDIMPLWVLAAAHLIESRPKKIFKHKKKEMSKLYKIDKQSTSTYNSVKFGINMEANEIFSKHLIPGVIIITHSTI